MIREACWSKFRGILTAVDWILMHSLRQSENLFAGNMPVWAIDVDGLELDGLLLASRLLHSRIKNNSYEAPDYVPRIIEPEFTMKRTPNWRISSTGKQILSNLKNNPLNKGEQLNLIGGSGGSVIIAQAALMLADQGVYIDNLILLTSPISKGSQLYNAVTNDGFAWQNIMIYGRGLFIPLILETLLDKVFEFENFILLFFFSHMLFDYLIFRLLSLISNNIKSK